MPAAERPPRRTRSHAGIVSRLVGSAVDLALVTFLAGQGLGALLAVLGALLGSVPQAVVAALTFTVGLLALVYLALSWRLAGRTAGGVVAGYAVVAADGSRLGIGRATVRAVLSVTLVVVWAVGLLAGAVDPARRGWLDRVAGSRTPYRVHRAGGRQPEAVRDDRPWRCHGRAGADRRVDGHGSRGAGLLLARGGRTCHPGSASRPW